MLNLFVLVILKEFDDIIDTLENKVNLQQFNSSHYSFRFHWNAITSKY